MSQRVCAEEETAWGKSPWEHQQDLGTGQQTTRGESQQEPQKLREGTRVPWICGSRQVVSVFLESVLSLVIINRSV